MFSQFLSEYKPISILDSIFEKSMDYIREFDIRLEKEMYYAGETLTGKVILHNIENFKLKGKLAKHRNDGNISCEQKLTELQEFRSSILVVVFIVILVISQRYKQAWKG